MHNPRLPRSLRGFTLIELLVVMAIIGILIALLLPAIQQAREAARRTQCRNHLHQIGVALHNYQEIHGPLPSGFIRTHNTLWTAMILPQIEQKPLYDTLVWGTLWETPGSANQAACGNFLSVLRCPSEPAPEVVDFSVAGFPTRAPCSYLACASGTVIQENGRGFNIGLPGQDGLFFNNSSVRFRDITDGSSATVAVAEAQFRLNVTGPDPAGILNAVDHWYIGGTRIQLDTGDASEVLGSTGLPINRVLISSAPIEEKELCFSSWHSGGCFALFGDGHVRFVNESIDRPTWSHLGSRNDNQPVGEF